MCWARRTAAGSGTTGAPWLLMLRASLICRNPGCVYARWSDFGLGCAASAFPRRVPNGAADGPTSGRLLGHFPMMAASGGAGRAMLASGLPCRPDFAAGRAVLAAFGHRLEPRGVRVATSRDGLHWDPPGGQADSGLRHEAAYGPRFRRNPGEADVLVHDARSALAHRLPSSTAARQQGRATAYHAVQRGGDRSFEAPSTGRRMRWSPVGADVKASLRII